MNQCFGRTKWFANVWVNLPLKKPLNKKKQQDTSWGALWDPQNPPNLRRWWHAHLQNEMLRRLWMKSLWFQRKLWMTVLPKLTTWKVDVQVAAQLQWGKLGMQCTQTAWEFSFSTCWPVVVINFHPNYWLHCPPDRHQLVHISLGHKQWQMSTGKVIPTIISLNRLVYKFHYFFHGVLTSRLSLTIYANKTRAGSRWRCWWPKQFEV